MRIPAKVTYALLLSALLVSCCLNSGSMVPLNEEESLEFEEPVIYEASEGRDEGTSSAEVGLVLVGAVLLVSLPLPVAAGVLYVWANSLAADQPESGTRNVFSASDHTAATTNGGDDQLLRMSFSYAEDDLNWAFIDIKIEVGDMVFDCGFDSHDYCFIGEQTDDGVWGATEHITLSEGNINIVGESGANVNIFVKYRNAQVAGDDSEHVA